KTTLLQALKNKKYSCYEESSREVIKAEVLLGSECLPWKNLACFARKVLHRMEEQLVSRKNDPSSVAFFDRGIPDIIAYLNYGGLKVEDIYLQILQQHVYESIVFLAPPWEAIYVNDPERWQTFAEAKKIHEQIIAVYKSFGFNLVLLPKANVAERVDFVCSMIKQNIETL